MKNWVICTVFLSFLGKYKKKDSLNIKIEDVQRKERQLKFSKELFIFQNSRFFRDKKIPKRLAIDFKKKWLNNYHMKVFNNLKSKMNNSETLELKKACSAI